jgi:hypothetical protein
MKNIFLFASLLLIGAYIISCKPQGTDSVAIGDIASVPVMTKEDSIKRGEYLSHIMGCNDCHTPKIMTDKGPALDMSRLLSGHPADEPLPAITDKKMIGPGQWVLFNLGQTSATGPWGTSFAANLTPDDTGIGAWSFQNFEQAIRQGKFKGMDGGRMIMPPMPWQNYAAINDEDLANLWLYLNSIKPVKNVVPAYVPPAQG